MTSFNHVAAEADGNCKDGTEAGMAPNIVNQTETTAELSRDKSSQNEIDKRCGCGPCHPKCLQVRFFIDFALAFKFLIGLLPKLIVQYYFL